MLLCPRIVSFLAEAGRDCLLFIDGSFLRWNDHGCLLHFDQAGSDPFLELREDRIDLITRFDEFDFDRQMVRDFENVGGVDAVCVAESGDAFYDCGPGDCTVEE
jgi:hypothetical protein